MKFSVVIPAYAAWPYLADCLRSVVAQTTLNGTGDYEIVIGVDGCPKTRVEALRLGASYPQMRVLWFPTNRGSYVTRNTLAYASRGEFLIFFDADDVMLPGLAAWCDANFTHPSSVMFRFWRVFNSPRRKMLITKGAAGVFGIRRESFEKVGGFKPWRCAADAEFHPRASRLLGPPVVSHEPLFEYRKHAGCVTSLPLTSGTSKLRRHYHEITRREHAMKNPVLRVEPVTAPFEELAP